MNDDVRSVFSAFSAQFEGRVEYMYVDVKDLVSIGIGNLIDPVELAIGLPFVFKSDTSVSATEQDIRADFAAVKSDPSLAQRGHLACEPLTKLQLTDDAIDNLVAQKLDQVGQQLKETAEFANFETWPADAQLALLSMAWAAGPKFAAGGRFPSFRAACAAQDWVRASAECHMDDTANPGLRPRNVGNRVLFLNADFVVKNGLDQSTLQYVVSGARNPVKSGSSGADVSFLQARLATLGYDVDQSGTFDDKTDQAVRRFQTDQALGADGIVGPIGWAALGTCIPAAVTVAR